MENSLETLLTKVRSYNSDFNSDLIIKAYNFALEQHGADKRLTGETLVSHLLNVAHLVADIQLDDVSLAAALLHESLRRNNDRVSALYQEFGSEITGFVEILTQFSNIQFLATDTKLEDNVKKVFFLFAKDIRIALVRLADRVENVKTIYGLSSADQVWAGRQALNFYAPIAEMLGVRYFQRQLENGGFAVLHPDLYKQITSQMQFDHEEMERSIEEIRRRLLTELANENIFVEKVFGRAKHAYSIWKKLLRYQKEGKIKELITRRIYDQMALMVITKEVDDCYKVLGVINKMFTILPNEFDDYISKPKPNGYRALHTIVKDEGKRIFEIQIKTEEMHRENEFGQAAHFYYKQQGQRNVGFAPDKKTEWIKQLADWSNANISEIFAKKIFIFSPKKDVYELPEGATPIDFAYAVHTKLGDQASGAKVDGKMVSLSGKLKNGQTVEIIIEKNRKGPSRDWLNFIVTQLAKKEIQKHFNENK